MLNQKISLSIFPIILVLVGYIFLQQISPVYSGALGYDQDPAYVYLLNGLSILDGYSPTHIDHPGTPVQLLSALVVLIRWVFLKILGLESESVISSALNHPEVNIQAISFTLLILIAWATFYLGRRVHESTNSIKLAIFCQTSPLAFWTVAPKIVYLAPEGLLIFSSLMMLGLLAPALLGKNEEICGPDKSLILAGVVCGFGIAAKFTFAPMLLLLLISNRKSHIAWAFVCAAVSFFIFISPIVTRIPEMWAWIVSLTTHSGHYGGGEKTFINLSAIPRRMNDLLDSFPFFYLVASIILLAVIAKLSNFALNGITSRSSSSATRNLLCVRTNVERNELRIPLLFLVVMTIQTVLVIKHPGDHYMLPVLPLAYVGAIWLVQHYGGIFSSSYSSSRVSGFLLGIAGILTIYSITTAYSHLRENRRIAEESLADIRAELAKYPDPLVIGAYRCTLPECALSFGSWYAPSLVSRVSPILRNFVSFSGANILFYSKSSEGWVSPSRVNSYIAEGREVFFISASGDNWGVFPLKLVVKTPKQTLYKVSKVVTN